MPLQVSVVTPEREVWSGEASFVLARADAGDLGILPGHAPFLGALHHNRLVVETEDGTTYVAVHGGFVEASRDQVTILTEKAEIAQEIDVERARAQVDEARRRLEAEDTPENRAAVERAENRLRTRTESGLERG